MDRRTALKQSALFAGGLALLPSCHFGPDRELVALDHLQIDLDHQDLLAQVIETIIPSAKDSPGAESLNLYRFVLVMVDDCEPKENQQLFVNGLNNLQGFAKNYLKTSFPVSDKAKNEELLRKIITMEDDGSVKELGDIKKLLAIAKKYTVEGYMVSEYIMTKKFPYQLVPGPYQACVSTDGLIVM